MRKNEKKKKKMKKKELINIQVDGLKNLIFFTEIKQKADSFLNK